MFAKLLHQGGVWICLLQQRSADEETSSERNKELNPERGGLWGVEIVGDGRKREFSIRKIREGPGLGETTSRALQQVGKQVGHAVRAECTGRLGYYKRRVPRAVCGLVGEELDRETLEGAANSSLESEGEDLDIALRGKSSWGVEEEGLQ